MFFRNKKSAKKVLLVGIGKSTISSIIEINYFNTNIFLWDFYKKKILYTTYLYARINIKLYLFNYLISDVKTILIAPGVSFFYPCISYIYSTCLKYYSLIKNNIDMIPYYTESVIFAITGTNGKTTCSIFAYYALKNKKYKVAICGNIGFIFFTYKSIVNYYEMLVVELSSFYLEIISNILFNIVLIVNIKKDHLYRYRKILSYYYSKNILLLKCKKKHCIIFFYKLCNFVCNCIYTYIVSYTNCIFYLFINILLIYIYKINITCFNILFTLNQIFIFILYKKIFLNFNNFYYNIVILKKYNCDAIFLIKKILYIKKLIYRSDFYVKNTLNILLNNSKSTNSASLKEFFGIIKYNIIIIYNHTCKHHARFFFIINNINILLILQKKNYFFIKHIDNIIFINTIKLKIILFYPSNKSIKYWINFKDRGIFFRAISSKC